MKILYVTTVARTMNFFPRHIQMLQEEGHTVEFAANFNDREGGLRAPTLERGCVQHNIPFSRSPLSRDNLTACRELKKLLAENHYDIIHTHTPNASAIVRLVCRELRKSGTKVFYTAHGFHFYTGAPLKNWLVYYPVERFLSRWTDTLITINSEDYERAKRSFHAKRTVYIPGVGIDLRRFSFEFSEEDRRKKRDELGVPQEATVLASVGELNDNKNQSVVICAMAKLADQNVHYILCGQGEREDGLRQLAEELGVAERVHFLGFRTDVPEIYPAADIYLCPSFREGLNVSIMEAMASGLPVVCSDIRGNRDLIEDEKGGLLCGPDHADEFAAAVSRLLIDPKLRDIMGSRNREAIRKFSLANVLPELKRIYEI